MLESPQHTKWCLPDPPKPTQNTLRSDAQRKSGGLTPTETRTSTLLLQPAVQGYRASIPVLSVYVAVLGKETLGVVLLSTLHVLWSKRQRVGALRIIAVEVPGDSGNAKVRRRRRSQDHRALRRSFLIIHEASDRRLSSHRTPRPTQAGTCNQHDGNEKCARTETTGTIQSCTAECARGMLPCTGEKSSVATGENNG